MNTHVFLPPNLVDAENPLEWAWENLEFINRGEHACVFAHPEDENAVIRVSDCPDGWFAYALRVSCISGHESGVALHAPRAWGFAWNNGVCMGISERLSPPSGMQEEMWVRAAPILLGNRHMPDTEDLMAFEEGQPEFDSVRQFLTEECTDLRESNWMMRADTLVLNDPQAAMTTEEEEDFISRFGPYGRTYIVDKYSRLL